MAMDPLQQHEYNQARARGWVLSIVGVIIAILGGLAIEGTESSNRFDRQLSALDGLRRQQESTAPGYLAIFAGAGIAFGGGYYFNKARKIAVAATQSGDGPAAPPPKPPDRAAPAVPGPKAGMRAQQRFCHRCGEPLVAAARFCQSCGERIARGGA